MKGMWTVETNKRGMNKPENLVISPSTDKIIKKIIASV